MQETTAFTAKPLGDAVRKYRTKLDMTQEQLADACGLHPVYVSMLERGKRHPTLDKVFLIAEALHISPEKLVREVSGSLDA